MTIPFGVRRGTLRDRCEELPDDATLITPLANNRFRITGVQDQRIIIEDTRWTNGNVTRSWPPLAERASQRPRGVVGSVSQQRRSVGGWNG